MPTDKPILLNSLLDNSELKLKPFYHTDLKNNLEGIVFKEAPEQEKGILEKVFSDKPITENEIIPIKRILSSFLIS